MICPKCSNAMHTEKGVIQCENGEGVEVTIDHCGMCGGIFLDHGELDLLESEWRKIGALLAKKFAEQSTQ